MENDHVKLLWNFSVQTDRIEARTPDLDPDRQDNR